MASVWFEGVEQLNTVAVDIAKIPAASTFQAQVAVRKVALDVQATAQQLCPVDTGFLMNSIGTDFTDNNLTAAIGPTASYGAYVEFGTSRMAPEAYMGPALDLHGAQLETALSKLRVL